MAEDVFGLVLTEDAGKFVMDAGPADRLQVAKVALEPGAGQGLDLEAEARRVADGAEDAGGVVPEGALVEDADKARVEVREAADGVEDLADVGAGQAEGEGVDAEVAAEKVPTDRGRRDGG